MADYYSQFDVASKAFDENLLDDCDNETLRKYLISFATEPIPNTAVQHRNIIRGITINHILLQRHIDNLNKQNTKTQNWVIALAVTALISSVVQIFSPLLFQSPPTAPIRKTPEIKSAIPSQALPPASGQSSPKKSVPK